MPKKNNVERCPLCGAAGRYQKRRYGLTDVAWATRGREYAHVAWSAEDGCWACDGCGEDWGLEYDDPNNRPCGWNFCSRCGREFLTGRPHAAVV